MELLTPLNRYFAKNTPKTRDIIRLGIDICKALEVCQKYKIVHRDIKPNNIFISDTGMFKLGDFGVARTLEKTSSGLSKKGTYTYMAPEVYKGEEYGSNVDIYSLGIVMYKLLNNNMEPFRTERNHSDEENALIRRLRGDAIPKPANADGRLAEIVIKACSYEPKERYESPLQMREELESILYDEQEEAVIFPKGDKLGYEASVSVDDDKGEETVSLFGARPADNYEESIEEDEETTGIFGNRTAASSAAADTEQNDDFEEKDETVGIFGSRKEQEDQKRQEAMDYWTKKIEEAGKIAEENKHKAEEAQAKKAPQKEKKPSIEKLDAKKPRKKKSPLKILGIILGSVVGALVLLLVVMAIVTGISIFKSEKDIQNKINNAVHVDFEECWVMDDWSNDDKEEIYVQVVGYIPAYHVAPNGYVNMILQNHGEDGACHVDYYLEDGQGHYYAIGQKIEAIGPKYNYYDGAINVIARELTVLDRTEKSSGLVDDVTEKLDTPELDKHSGEVVTVIGTIDSNYSCETDTAGGISGLHFDIKTPDGKTLECHVYEYHLDDLTKIHNELQGLMNVDTVLEINGILDMSYSEKPFLEVTGYSIVRR
jgi:hypothetical protein